MNKKILVIEDEPGIGMAIKDELEFEGFAVQLAQDGLTGFEAIQRSSPQLIVLDLMLPGKNGFQICQEIRERGITTPIVILTARGQETDKVRGLELGADDYVTKPFSLAELVARIRAVLRRYDNDSHRDIYRMGPLTLDLTRHDVSKGGTPVPLTDKEFQILALLMKKPGVVVSRDEFLNTVWGEEVYVTHRTVDTHISALRKKIEEDPEKPVYILSVRNVGYKFAEAIS